MEFTLLWAALTGVTGLWIGVRLWAGDESDSVFDDLLLAAGVGLLGGRVTAMLAQGLNPVANIGDLLIVRGGVSTAAAAVFAVGALFLTTGRQIRILDGAASAALLGLAGWHLGCLWRGACLGTASSLPWAWSEAGSSITRHPVEVYAAVGMLGAAILVSRLPEHVAFRSGAALALAAGIRLASEPFRLSVIGGPVGWYAAGIGVGVAVVAVSAVSGRRPT